jgi:hypothetical protein
MNSGGGGGGGGGGVSRMDKAIAKQRQPAMTFKQRLAHRQKQQQEHKKKLKKLQQRQQQRAGAASAPTSMQLDDDSKTESKGGAEAAAAAGNDSDDELKYQQADPLYDASADAEDLAWVNKRRKTQQQQTKTGGKRSSTRSLSCACCFSPVCDEFQQHETYSQQFRAMTVRNVTLQHVRKENFSGSSSSSRSSSSASSSTAMDTSSNGGGGDEVFFPAVCDECDTEVAMYSPEENVYHLFNVLLV